MKFVKLNNSRNQRKMSLLPFFTEYNCPAIRNRFELELYPEDLFQPLPVECALTQILNGFPELEHSRPAKPKSHVDKDGFHVTMDVRHYDPKEISVKTVDNSIVVEAKHEEKKDEHGYISRQCTRRYELPKGFKAEDVVSSLSSDGILTIKAARPKAIEGNTRNVEIQQIGPARTSDVTKNAETKEMDAE